jgi:hypothetical protein
VGSGAWLCYLCIFPWWLMMVSDIIYAYWPFKLWGRFLLLSGKSSLCFLDTSPLTHIISNIFFCYLHYLFISLIVFLQSQNF